MSELPDYGRDLMEINRAIRRLAPTCGVDLNSFTNISALLDDTNLPVRTVQDKARVTLRGLMFLRLKVWQELRA
jgi:hypothetical protein